MTTLQDVSPFLAPGLAALNFARGAVEKLIDACPANARLHCVCPGANHLTWIVGHLAWTDDYFVTALGGQESNLPGGFDNWNAMFGMASTPVDDPAAYPPFEQVRRAFDERHQAVVDWFASLDESKLSEPLPDDLRNFAPTFAALPGSMAAHEGMHAGQITVIRKSLGLPLVMG